MRNSKTIRVITLVVICLFLTSLSAFAMPSGFPKGFNSPIDKTLQKPIGGFGGGSGEIQRNPVIFVPGTTRNANDFEPVYNYLLSKGYTPNELWSVTYGNETDLFDLPNLDNHEDNVEDLAKFVDEVLRYAKTINPKVTKVDLIGHSMGGTLIRYYLKKFNAYDKVGAVVSVAAGNHGVPLCEPDKGIKNWDELYIGSPFIKYLNEPEEAPGPTRYMTLYDGSGTYDTAFSGTSVHSPALKGAENHPLSTEFGLQVDHFTSLSHPKAMELTYDFLSKSTIK